MYRSIPSMKALGGHMYIVVSKMNTDKDIPQFANIRVHSTMHLVHPNSSCTCNYYMYVCVCVCVYLHIISFAYTHQITVLISLLIWSSPNPTSWPLQLPTIADSPFSHTYMYTDVHVHVLASWLHTCNLLSNQIAL